MNIRVTAMFLLILSGCDVTDISEGDDPVQLESPVLAFEIIERPATEPAIVDPDESTNPTDTPITLPVSPGGASSPTTPATPPGSSEGAIPMITTMASLSNSGTAGSVDSFWVCSNDQATRSFRYQFSSMSTSSSQVYPGTVTVREDTDWADGKTLGYDWWKISADDAIEIAPTRTEFDPVNYRWSSIQFNVELTRVRLSDSRGFELSCARIEHSVGAGCSFEDYAGCTLPPEDTGDNPIHVVWEITSTERLINGSTPDLATNYWACERDGGNAPFRMKIGSARGVRVLEGLTGDQDSTTFGWRTDTVGAIHFTRTFSGITTSVWQLYDFSFAEDAQTFLASDTQGFGLSCLRQPESSRWSPGLVLFSCFSEPERCDDE